MDVDAITWKGGKDAKGKSKGKGKGKPQQKDSAKETRECWICGKAGHLYFACWYKDSDKDGGSGGSKGKGRSKMKGAAPRLAAWDRLLHSCKLACCSKTRPKLGTPAGS